MREKSSNEGSQRVDISDKVSHSQITPPRFKKEMSQHMNLTDEDEEASVDFFKEHEELHNKKHKKFTHFHLKEWLARNPTGHGMES